MLWPLFLRGLRALCGLLSFLRRGKKPSNRKARQEGAKNAKGYIFSETALGADPSNLAFFPSTRGAGTLQRSGTLMGLSGEPHLSGCFVQTSQTVPAFYNQRSSPCRFLLIRDGFCPVSEKTMRLGTALRDLRIQFRSQ